jgi:type IV pilus assembly protein PilC
MAVLFRSGLSSTEIMDITIESCNNKLMTQALMRVKEEMLKGEGIAQPMSRDGLFLPMMVEMVRVGEETGGLGETLVIVSQTYDAEADAKSRTFSRFLQTAVTMGISAMVFIVVLIMFSAMYSIYGQMSL